MTPMSRRILAVAASTLGACAVLAGCGSSHPSASKPPASTQTPTAKVCNQLLTLTGDNGVAASVVSHIEASAAGTPIAGWVSQWGSINQTSAAAISGMTQAEAVTFVSNTVQVDSELHTACKVAGVPGVMSSS
jgi:hypothetical protein